MTKFYAKAAGKLFGFDIPTKLFTYETSSGDTASTTLLMTLNIWGKYVSYLLTMVSHIAQLPSITANVFVKKSS